MQRGDGVHPRFLFKNEELDNNRNHPAADGTLCDVSPAGIGRLALPAPRGATDDGSRRSADGYCRDRQRQTRGNKGGLDLVDTWSTKIHAVINSVDVNGNERNVSNIVWAENPAYDGATGIASMTNDESQNGYRGQSVTSLF